MYEIKNNTTQILLNKQERNGLIRELEEMFVLADSESPRGMYSSENIERKYHFIGELYNILNRG